MKTKNSEERIFEAWVSSALKMVWKQQSKH